MRQSLQQTYRHLVQQQIVQREMRSLRQTPTPGAAWKSGKWETGGIFALFSAAAVCGAAAQVHWG